MFIGPLLKVWSLFVIPLVLGYKHLQYLMNGFPAQPVTANDFANLFSQMR